MKHLLGCVSFDEEEYRENIYFTYAPPIQNYQSFLFSIHFLNDYVQKENRESINLKEWAAFTNQQCIESDIKKILYKTDLNTLKIIYNAVNKRQPISVNDSLNNNSFVNWFKQTHNLEVWQYILYTRQCEPYVYVAGAWDSLKKDEDVTKEYIANGEKLYAKSHQMFIKVRYGYQVTRLAHYSNHYQDAISYYDKYVEPLNTKSCVKLWALAHKAGCLRRLKYNDESAYWFSRVFDKSLENKVLAYNNFNWLDTTVNKEACYKLCKNNHEKAVMAGMFGMRAFETSALDEMKDIYNLEPDNDILDLLLVREVNKIEFALDMHKAKREYIWWLNRDDDPKTILNMRNRQQDMITWCEQILKENKLQSTALWHAALGHLYLLTNEYVNAGRHLDKADELCGNDTYLRNQIRFTRLWMNIKSTATPTKEFENKIASDLAWFDWEYGAPPNYIDEYDYYPFNYGAPSDSFKKEPGAKYLTNVTRSVSRAYFGLLSNDLAPIYKKDEQNKYIVIMDKCGLAYDILHKELDAKDVETLRAYCHKKDKTPFDEWACKGKGLYEDLLNDLQGTTYVREGRYEAALPFFKRVSPDYWISFHLNVWMAANPFADHLIDTHAPTKADTVKYTKVTLTEQLVKLDNLIKTDKKNASKYYYALATARYNMSYYGNSWMMNRKEWSGAEPYEPDTIKVKDKNYYYCTKAKELYGLALELSTDKEFKARCVYMLAKCEQKKLNVSKEFANSSSKDFIRMTSDSNVYLKQLNTQYVGTKFAREAITECTYYSDYVSRH